MCVCAARPAENISEAEHCILDVGFFPRIYRIESVFHMMNSDREKVRLALARDRIQ